MELDYKRTARVVQGIINAINQLFGQEDPLETKAEKKIK